MSCIQPSHNFIPQVHLICSNKSLFRSFWSHYFNKKNNCSFRFFKNRTQYWAKRFSFIIVIPCVAVLPLTAVRLCSDVLVDWFNIILNLGEKYVKYVSEVLKVTFIYAWIIYFLEITYFYRNTYFYRSNNFKEAYKNDKCYFKSIQRHRKRWGAECPWNDPRL